MLLTNTMEKLQIPWNSVYIKLEVIFGRKRRFIFSSYYGEFIFELALQYD